MSPPAFALATLFLLAPPFDGPPAEPLERYEPRIYDLKFGVTINTAIPYNQDDPRLPQHPEHPRSITYGRDFELEDAPIVMPLTIEGAYHQIAGDSVAAELYLEHKLDAGLRQRFRLEEGLPFRTHLAVLPILRFRGDVVAWNVSYRLQSFSSRIDDERAARVPWPREWPEELADALRPQMYIESDDPLFAETVARVSEGNLRLVPPYLAAKDLVRFCVNEIQVTGNGVHRGRLGVLHGLDVQGALETARTGTGSPHDLVCVCVAMLRAAGIPARPVIGVTKHERKRPEFVTWAEMFLPSTGWVPFDPDVMRGKGIRHRDVRQPWPEFGTLDDLNRRVPLAYAFLPPRAVVSPQYPAVWGWDPRPGGSPDAEQIISITIVSRGPGVEDAE